MCFEHYFMKRMTKQQLELVKRELEELVERFQGTDDEIILRRIRQIEELIEEIELYMLRRG